MNQKKNFPLQLIILLLLFFSMTIALIACGGRNPSQEDLPVLKKTFLKNRSMAFLNPQWRSYSDQELFFLTCQQKQLDCASSLQWLQKHDPIFYNKLFPNEAR